MKQIITFIFVIMFCISFSQNDQVDATTSFTRLNLGLHGLELTHELPFSNSFVWENSLGLGMGNSLYDGDVNYTFALDVPVPFITSELKYLYSRKKRTNKGRSTLNNSGNYIGLQAKYSFGNSSYIDLSSSLLTEIHWGIQRPLGKRFLFDFHIGLGMLSDFDFEREAFSPTLGLRFGYILFPSK